jgi:hypothetical protein
MRESGMKAIKRVYVLAGMMTLASLQAETAYKPPTGFVPDPQTAVAIAMAVWKPIYGEKAIRGKRPYKATLQNGVWSVIGSLPKGVKGGVPEAKIAQDDGRILYVSHGK